MITCNNCNNEPEENDKIIWECHSCGKRYGLKFSFLQQLWSKKGTNTSHSIMKCKQCGQALDDGNEKITWECICGNKATGNLKDFIEKEAPIIENTSLVDTQNTSLNIIENQNNFCPNCGSRLEPGMKFCPNCGYQFMKTNMLAKRNQKNKRRRFLKLGIGFAVILLLVGMGVPLYRHFNSPITKLGDYLESNQIKNAQKIYDDTIVPDGDTEEACDKALSVLNDKVNDYGKDASHHKYYIAVLDFVKSNFPDADVSKATNLAEKLSASKENYTVAERSYKKKKYNKAIDCYEKVIKQDGLYPSAQEKIETCKNELKTDIINKIEAQISSDTPSLEETKAEISKESFLKDDPEINDKLLKLKQSVKAYALKKAKSQESNKKYKDAYISLNYEIPKEFQNDSDVTAAKNALNTKLVQWLKKETDSLIKNKKYEKALYLLNMYKNCHKDSNLNARIPLINKKIKDDIISTFKNLKRKLTIKYDSVEQTYDVVQKGYSTNYINISPSINIEARAVVDKRDKINSFDFIVGFEQSDWIFTELVRFASGKYRKTFYIGYSDRYTQVDYGSISEWMYLNNLKLSFMEKIDNKFIQNITSSNKAVLRFSGDGTGQRNHIITGREKDNIKTVYKFCEMLNKYNYLYHYI